ncbi:hypothetical protein ACIOG4_27635 [Streptomyces microflavus]|uniref:hypothetical protein n=1 Tax=Streptomyces microflavus TaxID=1919 RepID=UPI0037FF7B24
MNHPRLSPRERIAPYEPMLREKGWRVAVSEHPLRARLEGFHPSGTVLMITSDTRRRHRPSTPMMYVLQPDEDVWRRVRSADLEYFAGNLVLASGSRFLVVGSKCRCSKARFTTEAAAAVRLAEIAASAPSDAVRPVRHYRCDADDRVWHLTSKPDGYAALVPLADAYRIGGVPRRRPSATYPRSVPSAPVSALHATDQR